MVVDVLGSSITQVAHRLMHQSLAGAPERIPSAGAHRERRSASRPSPCTLAGGPVRPAAPFGRRPRSVGMWLPVA